jgi:hypothetical protein
MEVPQIKNILRNLRDGGLKSGLGYIQAEKIYNLLPSLCAKYPQKDLEIHILVGNDRVSMALWMVASWVLTTEMHWRFVFHDDGTLSPRSAHKITRAVSNAKIILSEDSTKLLKKELAEYPNCSKCRNLHPLSRKLFDIPFFSNRDKFLTIDTDILFYLKPLRLIQWATRDDDCSIFMRDTSENVLPEAVNAARIFGSEIVSHLNTGIVAMNRKYLDLGKIERSLSETNLLSGDPWFIEQSLYAAMASIHGEVELLDFKTYQLSLTNILYPESICRHYVGKVRHLFYSEGIPKVIEGFKRAKQ